MLASEINDLKARVKAEMRKRRGYPSLYNYGGTSYDYTTDEIPSTSHPIYASNWNKIVTPMNAIKNRYATVTSGLNPALAMNIISSDLSTNEYNSNYYMESYH